MGCSVKPIVQQFLDTAEIASQTSRIALSSAVLQMREYQREFERIAYPECMENAYRYLSVGMDTAVDAFNAFMANKEGVTIVYLDLATQYFFNAYHELGAISAGALEYRLFDTAVFVWGGESPNEAEATSMAATRSAPTPHHLENSEVTWLPPATFIPTPVAARSSLGSFLCADGSVSNAGVQSDACTHHGGILIASPTP